jgi:hypothetical protein
MKPFEKLLQHDLAHIGERLLLAVVVIAATFAGVRLITRLIERVRQRLPNESASIYVAEKLVSYGLIVMGAITALSVRASGWASRMWSRSSCPVWSSCSIRT